MADALGADVQVLCLGGLSSPLCDDESRATMRDTAAVHMALQRLWRRNPGAPVVLASPSLRGFDVLVSRLEARGRNPLLVEATGGPEAELAGLSVDALIAFNKAVLGLTEEERRGAKRVEPPVSRRQAFRSFFRAEVIYAIQPRPLIEVPERCRSLCPYSALAPEGPVASRCRGCMLCATRCPGVFEPPRWGGAASMAYLYGFADAQGLDGVLFICRRLLGELDERSAEASPARLIPFHVPCISWLSPRLLRVLEERLGLHVHVYASPACRECPLQPAAAKAASELRALGIEVSRELSSASRAAGRAEERRRVGYEEAAAALLEALEPREGGGD